MSEQQFSERLRALVAQHDGQLSPELRRAARWAAAHPAELCFRSLRAAAQAAGVSPPTMSRLARALGFDSYDAFRQPLREALTVAAQSGYVERLDVQRRTGRAGATAQQRAADTLQANAASALTRNAPADYAAAAARLLRARRVVFLGLRVSFGLAYHLHYVYGLVATNGELADDRGGGLADVLAGLGPQDLLVPLSLAPYTRQTVDIVERAVAAGVPVLALTDAAASPIGRLAEQVLVFDTESPAFFHSLVGAQAVIETLVAEAALRAGPKARRRLSEMQQHFTDNRAYWERPRRRIS